MLWQIIKYDKKGKNIILISKDSCIFTCEEICDLLIRYPKLSNYIKYRKDGKYKLDNSILNICGIVANKALEKYLKQCSLNRKFASKYLGC